MQVRDFRGTYFYICIATITSPFANALSEFIEVVRAALKGMDDGLALVCRKICGCEYELVNPVDIVRLRLGNGDDGETAEKGKR